MALDYSSTTYPRGPDETQLIRITDESQPFTVRRPGRHVDCSLPAIHISDNPGLATRDWHEPQVNPLVKGVIARCYIFGEGQEANPLTIGRDVREPVIVIVICDLLLLTSVRFHAPDLHCAAARRVKVDVLSVRAILRAVV